LTPTKRKRQDIYYIYIYIYNVKKGEKYKEMVIKFMISAVTIHIYIISLCIT